MIKGVPVCDYGYSATDPGALWPAFVGLVRKDHLGRVAPSFELSAGPGWSELSCSGVNEC